MFQFLRKSNQLLAVTKAVVKVSRKNFLSQAYYCNEVWEQRLQNPLIQKVQLDELYQELDQRYQRSKQISAVDVDIFANAITETSYVNELLDLIYKLRLSADSSNVLRSTEHAVVRYLYSHGHRDELLTVVDDRLNYGVFLDYFTANILMNHYHKEKDFVAGVKIASQMMLQEEFDHSLCNALAIYHCCNFLITKPEWPEAPKLEEPEDEVKVRVKYLRNPFENNFDLKDSSRIIGKILGGATKYSQTIALNQSLHILGLILYGDTVKTKEYVEALKSEDKVVHEEIYKLIPEESEIRGLLKSSNGDTSLSELLNSAIEQGKKDCAERDIASQCELYYQWENERKLALDEQQDRFRKAERLKEIGSIQDKLKQKEELLWFFENEEKIELDIENKVMYFPKFVTDSTKSKKKLAAEAAELYVPPEIVKKIRT